jgi:hypothetical protein
MIAIGHSLGREVSLDLVRGLRLETICILLLRLETICILFLRLETESICILFLLPERFNERYPGSHRRQLAVHTVRPGVCSCRETSYAAALYRPKS